MLPVDSCCFANAMEVGNFISAELGSEFSQIAKLPRNRDFLGVWEFGQDTELQLSLDLKSGQSSAVCATEQHREG